MKAEAAWEGRTVRELAITLFQQWLRQKKQLPATAAPVDWQSFQAPLSHLVPENVTDLTPLSMLGNATGTDQAFAAGIIETAPERLELK